MTETSLDRKLAAVAARIEAEKPRAELSATEFERMGKFDEKTCKAMQLALIEYTRKHGYNCEITITLARLKTVKRAVWGVSQAELCQPEEARKNAEAADRLRALLYADETRVWGEIVPATIKHPSPEEAWARWAELGWGDPMREAMRRFTTPPRKGTPAANLTDGEKLALCIAAGVPTETVMEGGFMAVRTTVPCGVADRGDGGYIVAIGARCPEAKLPQPPEIP